MNGQMANNAEIKQDGSNVPPQQMVMQILSGLIFSMAIKSALELGVFRALKDGVRTAEELATSLKADPVALKRLLRALCSVGLLTEDNSHQYNVTKSGAALQEGPTPGSVESIAQYLLNDMIVQPMFEMTYSVRTGKPSFDKITGKGWYESSNAESLSVMDKAMEAYSKISLPSILEVYPFKDYNLVVDIAGGMGQMLAGILDLSKTAKGILFDTPATIERATDYVNSSGLAERCQLVGGDMFDAVPAGGDLYVISKALNDWDDDHVLRVLKNVRTVMGKSSKLVLVEQLGDEGIPTPSQAVRSLIMLVCTPGGSVRTQAEFATLIDAAGLKTSSVLATKSGFSVVECTG